MINYLKGWNVCILIQEMFILPLPFLYLINLLQSHFAPGYFSAAIMTLCRAFWRQSIFDSFFLPSILVLMTAKFAQQKSLWCKFGRFCTLAPIFTSDTKKDFLMALLTPSRNLTRWRSLITWRICDVKLSNDFKEGGAKLIYRENYISQTCKHQTLPT